MSACQRHLETKTFNSVGIDADAPRESAEVSLAILSLKDLSDIPCTMVIETDQLPFAECPLRKTDQTAIYSYPPAQNAGKVNTARAVIVGNERPLSRGAFSGRDFLFEIRHLLVLLMRQVLYRKAMLSFTCALNT